MLNNLLCSVLYSTLLSYFLNNGASVQFRLFKSMDIQDDIVFNLASPNHLKIFDALYSTAPTVMYMHGYLGEVSTAREYCNASVVKYEGKINCILVDWTSVAHNLHYMQVRNNLPKVSKEISSFIQMLVTIGHDINDFTLIGHSLGAHLSGLSAKRLHSSVGKVGTIIGLDPAGPGFSLDDVENRLDRSDAKYVLVLHTDTRMYGINETIGHADIYVNGGKRQPGCLWLPSIDRMDYCSHIRASQLWIETLTTDFESIPCKIWSTRFLQFYILTFGTKTIMGPNMSYARGVFYLETLEESPFIKPLKSYKFRYGVVVKNEVI